jgi:hypothetical protein
LLTFTILFAFTIGVVVGYLLKQSQLISTIEPPMSAKQEAVAASKNLVKFVPIAKSFDGNNLKQRENEIKTGFNNAAPIKLIHVTENCIPRKRLNFAGLAIALNACLLTSSFEVSEGVGNAKVAINNAAH